MKFILTTSLSIYLFFSFTSAIAVIEDHDTYILDTDTNLEWFKPRNTVNISWNEMQDHLNSCNCNMIIMFSDYYKT